MGIDRNFNTTQSQQLYVFGSKGEIKEGFIPFYENLMLK